ncbi:hypothetical protein Tco_0047670 [Tanacetum coccineum]
MAASAIAISSDSSDESVGSPPSRVILFGDIPIVIPSTSVVAPETSTIAPVISSVAPVVETTLVASPTGLCGLIPYSDSDSDSPDEMSSSEHISPLPAISPFLCTDSSEAPDSSDGPPSQDPYVMTVARWRSKDSFWILGTRDVSLIRLRLEREHKSSEAFRRWCAAPLSTLFICLEVAYEEDTVIVPKRTGWMSWGIGDGDDVRDHVEIDPRDVRDDTEEYEADTSAGDTVEVGIDPMSAPIVEEEIVEPAGEDSSDSFVIDWTVGFRLSETCLRLFLRSDQLIARGQRVSMIERIDSLRLENLKVRAMLDIERDRVNSLRLHMSLSQEEFRQVRRDRDDTRGRLRRLESYVERHLGFRP